MKIAIHPEYHLATVTCNCGNSFQVGSTLKEIRIEICAACHPFYTGKQNLIDTAGRVDKFKERQKKAVALQAKRIAKPKAAKVRGETEPTETEKLKEMKKALLDKTGERA